MNKKVYIGITGPVNVQETKDICREFFKAGYSMETNHIPMLGFLISYKTLNGQKTENKRYPPITSLQKILKATDKKVFTMIHYNSRERDSLSEQITKIFKGIYEEDLCRALQLNIVWPDLNQVKKIKKKYPEMKIVFQASEKATKGKNPCQIVNKIKKYGDSIDYVLIDSSGGRGIPLEINSSIPIYLRLKEKLPNLVIGFAGGLTGENVNSKLENIIKEIGSEDFCIDAEGGLRDKLSQKYGDDLLNLEKVRSYLQSASINFK